MTKRNRATVSEGRMAKKEAKGRVVVDTKAKPDIPLLPKTKKQDNLLHNLRTKRIVVAVGSAGTGKTYLTMGYTAKLYQSGKINKIALTRPAVGMGNTLGLLPGSLREKYEPYLLPLIDVFVKFCSKGSYESALNNGNMELVPLETLRGRSFEDSVCFVDEAQNVSPKEMFSIITRQGENSQLIILGDPAQKDLKGESGLEWLIKLVDTNPELQELVGVVEFTSEDIVRSEVCKMFVSIMEKAP